MAIRGGELPGGEGHLLLQAEGTSHFGVLPLQLRGELSTGLCRKVAEVPLPVIPVLSLPLVPPGTAKSLRPQRAFSQMNLLQENALQK